MNKKIIIFFVISVGLVSSTTYFGIQHYNSANSLLISTTTSVENTGLLYLIIDKFTEETGIKVSVIAKGSGVAVDLGRQGLVDAILVHAPSLEQELLDEGIGINRTTLWYNYFLIAGPTNDPANISNANNVTEAFNRIYDTQSLFYSRGDNSGTHIMELSIWKAVPDAAKDKWYIETGSGMSSTLVAANENPGYVLSDLGTYAQLSATDELSNLAIHYDEDDKLYNPYSYMVINPDKYNNLHTENAFEFLEFLQSDVVLKIVRGLVLGGVQLFTPIGE